MRLLNIKLLILIVTLFPLEEVFSQNPAIPSVKIKDHKENTDLINIDCDYDFLLNKGIKLTAKYPEIRQTNNYSVSSISYAPIEDFSQGNVVDISNNAGKLDDTYSKAVNLPFNFCFYGNSYSEIIISDNGVVSFNTVLAQQECPYAPPNPIPNGLPKNSIFGVFHDMQNINQVRYLVEGVAPNRRVIINYNNIPQYGYAMPGKNSSSQIVLYETTNIIDVYVKDRFQNNSTNPIFDGAGSYRKNAVIGLTNYDSSGGIAVPDRDTGNWEAHNEAWRFTPAGSTNITIQWLNQFDNEIAGTRNAESILVYPTQSTKYKVKLTYNICVPVTVIDVIEVQFSQDFPTANEVTTDGLCINNGDNYTLDLTSYEPQINPDTLLSFSYFEDINLTIPIASPKGAFLFSNNKTVYVKVLKSGVCYSVAKLNLRLNKRPVITPNQSFEKCDENNDGKETINLNALGITGLSGSNYKYFESAAAASLGTPAITNYTSYLLDVTAETDQTKTLYLRAWNASYNDLDCYTIIPFKIKLKKYVQVKKPIDPFLICNVTEGQLIKNYDLTQYKPQLLDVPTTGVNFEYYTMSNYSSSYKIVNPSSATFTMNTTIYIKATAAGYCDAFTQISLAADDDCDGTPGGGGGGGGALGPGGPGGGGGPICDTNETSITVNLDQDYLQFYLQGGLTLPDITILGFYDSANNSLLTDVAPYTYTFSPPFFKVIQARYKINATGIESYVNFLVSASKKATIDPDTFDVCDTYNDNQETITLQSGYTPKPKWQTVLETAYPDAAIHFFASANDLNNYIAAPDNPVNNSKIITTATITPPFTTVYVYVKYYGCVYTHEIKFNLIPVIVKPTNPYVVCDFDDDKKELVNLIKITNNETDVKNEITAAQLVSLQTPIRYYQTLTQAHTGGTDYIVNLTNFEINASQMSVFAKLNIKDECPVIVEIKFQFTTSVALPVLKDLIICDTDNDNQEEVNLTNGIVSNNPNAELTFYGTQEAAEAGDETSPFFISAALASNYLVTVSPASIYVRVYDQITTCWKILNFKLTLVKTPILTNTIIKTCDSGDDEKEVLTSGYIQAQLIGNNTSISSNMIYKFYETQNEAIANSTSPLTTFEATRTNSIWVNIAQNIGDCPIIEELTFDLVKPPVLATSALVYIICNNNTGNENGAINENVILDSYKNDILGFSASPTYAFTYYDTTENDAINGGTYGAVPSAYAVTSFPKTIRARVTNTVTGCFSIKSIEFQQTPSLESVISDSEIIACASGEMSKEVNLQDYPSQMIIAPGNLNDFNISYHNSRANAVGNIILTSDITHYIVTPASQIWLKFVSKTTGCYIIKKLSVTIYSTPKAQDVFPEVCDETDRKLDGNYIIPDLDVYKNQIITGESNLDHLYIFTYYKELDDATAKRTNTISNLNYTFNETDLESGPYPDPDCYSNTVYARIDKQDNTGCFSVVAISFQINKKVPVNAVQPEILKCDESDNDGKTIFDLTSIKDEISTTLGVSFKYYPTKEDAQNDTNEITNSTNWENLTPYEHIVYIRTSASGYCDNIAAVKLKVYPYIQAIDYTDNSICEFKSDGITENTVNLLEEAEHMTSQINTIIEFPDLLDDITISFYTNLADAQTPTLSNSIPTANLTNYMIPVGTTEIWVRFESKTTHCFEIKKLTLTKLKAPEIKLEVTPFRCSPANDFLDAIVKIVPLKGAEPFSYSFDNGVTFSATDSFIVDAEQTVYYMVEDKNGCRISDSVFVPGYNPPTDMNIEASIIYCNTPIDAPIIKVNNIIGPPINTSYTYEIIDPAGVAPPNTTGVFSGLLPAVYQIKATDNATKCYVIKSIEVIKAPEIKAVVSSHNDVLCYGENTGTITYSISSFITSNNYTYDFVPVSLGIMSYQLDDTITFTDLPAGKYTFTVTDKTSGCTSQIFDFEIKQPTVPVTFSGAETAITCYGANDGKIAVTATGGTGAIKYAITPDLTHFSSQSQFDHLSPGIYQIAVQDESGCSGDGLLTLEIKEPAVLGAQVTGSVIHEICEGDKDGSFNITISGGTPPYYVKLDDGVYIPVTDSQYDFTNLLGGTHEVFIKDTYCFSELEVIMDNAVTLNPKAKVDYDCLNNAAVNSVIITINQNINPSDVDYALDNSTTYQQSNVFANVSPGMHTVTARHTNGCEQTTSAFAIDDVQKLTLTLGNGGINEIVATAHGGYGGYQYTFEGESNSFLNKIIIYKSGTYAFTVTDKKGCTATDSKYVEYIDVCIPDHFTPNGDGINDTWEPGCTVNYTNLTYEIFDRYGRSICKYKFGQKWDGKYNGNELPSGDYWYVIKLNDPKDNREFVGHFTLYR